jgi:hypothetical protein
MRFIDLDSVPWLGYKLPAEFEADLAGSQLSERTNSKL